MKVYNFSGKERMSVVTLLQKFKFVCDSCRIYVNAVIRLLE